MELSIVILNWNAADDTIRCVRQINQWTRLRPCIWVVDNASRDTSLERMRRECPAINLVRNSANLGFAGGTNQGILKALAENDNPILLLNNDAVIAEADVARLLATLVADHAIGLVGPLLFAVEDKERLISAGGKNPVLHHQTRLRRFDPARPLQPVDVISGTVILIRAGVFRQVGLLDESYFFSTELADLCARARQHGFRCVIDSRARAYHALERSSDFRRSLHVYYIIRNRFLYIRKFYRHVMKGMLYGFWAGYGLALTLKLLIGGQPITARAAGLGSLDGLRGRFGDQNERVLAALKMAD
jgi:GT2 family glycosyltransferase